MLLEETFGIVKWHYIIPSPHLLVQRQHWTQQNNVWKLFIKVNNKDTRTILLKLFCCQKDFMHCSDVSIVDLDKANVGWLSTQWQPDFPILIFYLNRISINKFNINCLIHLTFISFFPCASQRSYEPSLYLPWDNSSQSWLPKCISIHEG